MNITVCSFGLVLWEIFSFGALPYVWLSNKDASVQIPQGVINARPDGCPDAIWDIMLRCWQIDYRKRPDFSEVGFSFCASHHEVF